MSEQIRIARTAALLAGHGFVVTQAMRALKADPKSAAFIYCLGSLFGLWQAYRSLRTDDDVGAANDLNASETMLAALGFSWGLVVLMDTARAVLPPL